MRLRLFLFTFCLDRKSMGFSIEISIIILFITNTNISSLWYPYPSLYCMYLLTISFTFLLCHAIDFVVMICSLTCLLIFWSFIEFRSRNANGMGMMNATDSDVHCCLTLCVLIFIDQSTYWSAQNWYPSIYFRTLSTFTFGNACSHKACRIQKEKTQNWALRYLFALLYYQCWPFSHLVFGECYFLDRMSLSNITSCV